MFLVQIKFILSYSLQIPKKLLIRGLYITIAQPTSKHADTIFFHADTFLFVRLPFYLLCRYLSQPRFEIGVTLELAGNARRMFTGNRHYHLQLNIDVDVCIMAMNEWPKYEQECGDIKTDIGDRSCWAGK